MRKSVGACRTFSSLSSDSISLARIRSAWESKSTTWTASKGLYRLDSTNLRQSLRTRELVKGQLNVKSMSLISKSATIRLETLVTSKKPREFSSCVRRSPRNRFKCLQWTVNTGQHSRNVPRTPSEAHLLCLRQLGCKVHLHPALPLLTTKTSTGSSKKWLRSNQCSMT